MSRLNDKGIGIVGVIIALLVILIVGTAGWYVWKSQKAADTATVTDTTETSTQAKASTTPVVSDIRPEASTFSKVPVELQSAILEHTKTTAPDCVKDDKIVDAGGTATDQEVDYAEEGYAATGVGCEGSAKALFAKSGDRWVHVASTQSEFPCSSLRQYKVPFEFVAEITPGEEVPYCYDEEQGESFKYAKNG